MKLQPSRIIEVTPTITAGAYSTGDQVGGILEFDLGNDWSGGVAASLVIIDNAVQDADMELWLFENTIAGAGDNAAASLSDADMGKCIGVITSGTYTDLANNSQATTTGQNVVLQRESPRGIIWGMLVVRGTPTYVATNDLTIKLGILSD